MKYTVTGATGFLGSHVARVLEAQGHAVVRFSRSTGGDVLDIESVKRDIAGCDGVFHCAGNVSHRPEDAAALYRVHVEGTRAVLDACVATGVPKVVLASTSGTVAVSEDPRRLGIETDTPPIGLIGRWPYYRAKLFAEQAALARQSTALEVVAVNPSLLLGPGDARGSSTRELRAFLEGALLAVPAGGLSFVDVRDAADAMSSAMLRGRTGERYLVGACNLTMREFVGRLSRLSGVPVPWFRLPRSRFLVREATARMASIAAGIGSSSHLDPVMAEMATCFWYVDSTKAERQLGFRPRDPNVTLFDTVDDLRSRGVVWPRDRSGALDRPAVW
jgi:dihydroflavonol-4-reductase